MKRVNNKKLKDFFYVPQPSKYMYHQLEKFKKDPQSFIGHKKKIYNISLLKHDIQFIRKYKDYLNWEIISSWQKLTQDAIEEFTNYVVWEKIFCHQTLSNNFIRKHIDKINDYDWESICNFQNLDEQFLKEYKEHIVWHTIIIKHPDIPETFFEDKEIKSYIKMQQLTQRPLSEDFIRRHKDEFNAQSWYSISIFSKLSEKFMDEFANYLDWEQLSKWQTFGIRFALKYENKIAWNEVGDHVYLTTNFMNKFKNKLNWQLLAMTQLWNDKKIHQFLDYIEINALIYNKRTLKNITESCLREFFMEVQPMFILNMNKHFSKNFICEIWNGK